MPSITVEKSEKALFVFVNVGLAIVWLHFLFRLVTRWNAMEPNIRVHVGLFMMFFSFWWLTLIRKKHGFISLLMAGGVFVIVSGIVKMFM